MRLSMNAVVRKVILIPPLLFALWLLTDDGSEASKHKLAVWTALERHPPSVRVYRALLELNLLLFGTALFVFITTRTVGTAVLGDLLFAGPIGEHVNTQASSSYAVVAEEQQEDEGRSPPDEGEMNDADYDSEGEVPPPSPPPMPPTAHEVMGAALDLLVAILISLFGFTISSAEGGRYIKGVDEDSTVMETMSRIAAPVFPLVLFVGCLIFILLPWKRRRHFWLVLSYTIGAPFYDVTFRDGFVGDILTSSVRPMQDVAFTLFYCLSGLQGWWTSDWDLDDAAAPVERSWVLRTIILPCCMISPLWWRFLQNLKQTYDSKRRWPYLGNALKYLVAAEVAMFGVWDPNKHSNWVWLSCFAVATLYQVWWDVFMDWELLGSNGGLRKQRLYPYKSVYFTIMVVNFFLRFCWTLSFLPRKFLDRTGVLQSTFEGDISTYLGPFLASAEIVRRTLWGFLRFELEAIKVHGESDDAVKAQLQRCSSTTKDGDDSSKSEHDNGDIELHPMDVEAAESAKNTPEMIVFHRGGARNRLGIPNDMSSRTDLQILSELALWATVFVAGGMVAGAHRGTY